MKGLLLKDLYSTFYYCRAYFFIVAIFLVVANIGQENLFFQVYPIIMMGMIPMSVYAVDEKERWNTYCGGLPYRKSSMVSSKYILGLVMVTAASLLMAVLQSVISLINQSFNLSYSLSVLWCLILVGSFVTAVTMPIVFRFGTERARMIYLLFAGLLAVFSFFLIKTENISVISEIISGINLGLIIFVVVALYFVSWFASVKLFKNKEL